MKKSTLLFVGAAIAFLLCLTYVFVGFWNNALLKKLPFGRFPMIAFVFIFAAMFLGDRANKLNNIEHNRSANSLMTQTKGGRVAKWVVLSMWAVMVVVLVGKIVIGQF